jgi:hypothetical protein
MIHFRLLPGTLAMIGCQFLVARAFAQPDFRQANWGMTQAQVRATETDYPSAIRRSNGETILEYVSPSIGGLPGRALFIFSKDKLVRAKLIFEAGHSEPNGFIADFQNAESMLKERLGKPADDRALWTDDSTQDETKSYLEQDRATATGILPSDRFVGLAVKLGHLRMYTRRNSGRTEVWHTLWGSDLGVTHQIEYRSVSR